MTSVTVSIPEDIRRKMKEFPEINWSGVVRKIIENKVNELSWKQKLLSQLKKEEKFTNWTVEIGKKMKENRLKELKKKGII